ncbi:MAG: hypothetical protein ACREMQ_10800, partial [Longimicrobiales bacterium]
MKVESDRAARGSRAQIHARGPVNLRWAGGVVRSTYSGQLAVDDRSDLFLLTPAPLQLAQLEG